MPASSTSRDDPCPSPLPVATLVSSAGQGFWATERLGRVGEDMVYVRLRDGRGWVFETLNGKKVLDRVAPSTIPPPVENASADGDK